ncbi:MAG: helix-turn-helix domain-containing protein [Mycobacterium sp.]
MREDLDSLVDEFMARVHTLPGYQDPMAPLDQVRSEASRIFSYLLQQIGGQDEFDREATTAARDLGINRARAGIPLGDLLAAVHLDFQVLWNALRNHTNPEDKDLLVGGVELIWAAVEKYSTNVQSGYIEEESRASVRLLTERTRMISGMISGAYQRDEDFANLAAALGTDVMAWFGVVGIDRSYETDLRRVAQRFTASQQSTHIHPHGRANILLVELYRDDLSELSRSLDGIPCVVAPVAHGVRNLRRSCRLILEAMHLELAIDARPVQLESIWLQLVSAHTNARFPEIAQRVSNALDDVREVERERLIATAFTYAACGTITETANRTYCHRNTVLTRLNRLNDLTGYNMAVPAQAALLLLALLSRPDVRRTQLL